jgi:polyhydroxyalkanoate synthase subunit PhaC
MIKPELPSVFTSSQFAKDLVGNARTDQSVVSQRPDEHDSVFASGTAALEKIRDRYLEQFSSLYQQTLAATMPSISDRRFSDDAWHSNPWHAFNAAAYELNAQSLSAMADAVDAPPRIKQKIRFAIDQMVSASSPANFLFSNPQALQKIMATSGESLTAGIVNLLKDLRKGHISQSDETAFEVGRNIAITDGAVVFENAIFQLLQYAPLTKTVHRRPLLIVPPCINKYYILDLQQHNSFVRYAVEQGHTVFMMSWRNADASMTQTTWDHYIEHGVMQAINVVQDISKQKQISTLGFCIGGTMLSHALAALAGRNEHPTASVALLTTLLDFTDTGILDVYIDEMQIAAKELAIGQGGLMKGRDFSAAFSSLRPDDLIWHFVETNYLEGERPRPFDLLYWNADSTNLPGPMFCWYLRNTYLENNLKEPGKLKHADADIDLGAIDAPAFIYASRDDHIVPWQSAYTSTTILNRADPTQNHFVLGASGHVAGVVNPPAASKRHHWINPQLEADPQTWLADATQIAGSWWPAWSEFAAVHAGDMVAAPRTLGNARYKRIEPAPGRYVRARAE